MKLSLAPALSTPLGGRDVFRTYLRDFGSLPGFSGASWRIEVPDEIRITFVNSGFARLADNVLRDTVEGVRLVTVAASYSPSPDYDTWADNPSEMARAVAALPGVSGWTRELEHGIKNYGFELTNKQLAEHLRPLVNDRLGDGGVYFWSTSKS
jgi:hypothetical protein